MSKVVCWGANIVFPGLHLGSDDMWKDHLHLLVCPNTMKPLEIVKAQVDEMGAIRDGLLRASGSGNTYPIVNYIPRFVSAHNYADSFGYQWNMHLYTQQDSYTRVNLSKERFLDETKWGNKLEGEVILEAGCGSGRFTTHALNTGATVVSFDYSNAVDANYKVNGGCKKLLLVQADIYAMPFVKGLFDKAFCFGVLQHTPDPKKSFMEIASRLKPGGAIATDVYWKAFRNLFHIKFWFRPFTRKKPPDVLYKFVKRYVDLVWPFAEPIRGTYLGQKFISRIIADRSDLLPSCDERLLKEWAYLDTFDWLAPAFDKPQTLSTFKAWHRDAGLVDVEVHRGYNGLEGRGVRPG